jgi:hypothetical protein
MSNKEKRMLPVSVDEINRFEAGDMPHEEVVGFMQRLIDSGDAFRLQGFYGRTAEALIASGECHRAKVH